MRKFTAHILLLAALAAGVVSCGRKGRVIPRHKMAELYVKMLLADQWVKNDSKAMDIADTTLFYEPILAEAGYTKMDYVASVNRYMSEPEDFGKIFSEVSDILKEHIDGIKAARRNRDYADSLRRARAALPIRRPGLLKDMLADSVRRDTVSVIVDSTGMLVLERIMPDTTFYGPRYVLKSFADSLKQAEDSLKTETPGVAGKGPERKPDQELVGGIPLPAPAAVAAKHRLLPENAMKILE